MPVDAARNGGSFVLYVEGARDRDIMRAWSYRLLPTSARELFEAAVILGGRRPARALEHFRRLGGPDGGTRAVCVLDRDDGRAGDAPPPESGLEFFTWSRRHIESYLLVPDAIRRALRRFGENGRLDRALSEHLPPLGDEAAYREVDAKRLIGPNGVISRVLSRPVPLSGVARATREHELHADVHALFARLRQALGVVEVPAVRR